MKARGLANIIAVALIFVRGSIAQAEVLDFTTIFKVTNVSAAFISQGRKIMNRIHTSLLVIALFLALAPTALASNTWYVDGAKGNDSNDCKSSLTAACKTIGHAISLASSGDSVIVAAAIYTEGFTIGFSLNVIGSGASTTIIDGGGVHRVINIPSGNVTLSGRRGNASSNASAS
jgi:hypothetical protein